MKKTLYGGSLSALVVVLGLMLVFGSLGAAGAATSSWNAAVDMPMFQVARSGLDMTVGSVGPNVLVLETYLRDKGFLASTITPDQVFDANTRAALASYQAQGHVLSTGYFGSHTRAYLSIVLWFRMHGMETRAW